MTAGRAGRGPGHRGPLSDEDMRLWEMVKGRAAPLANPKRRVAARGPDRDADHAVPPFAGEPNTTGLDITALDRGPPGLSSSKTTLGKPKPTKATGTSAERAPPIRSLREIAGPAPVQPTPSKPANTLPAPAPLPTAIEKRKSRQLAKGQRTIDAVLDLHGMRQSEAHFALRHFLVRAQASGFKFVKVITGKGARPGDDDPRPFLPGSPGGERGVLKRLVPEWLREADLRRLVVGTAAAGRGHGGDGALYIELRRRHKDKP